MPLTLDPPVRRWWCPNCQATKRTQEALPHTPFHPCPRLRGASVPFLPEGTRGRHELRDREDYVGGEVVQVDGTGRPLMSAVTHRDDGEDCTVYVPCATAAAEYPSKENP